MGVKAGRGRRGGRGVGGTGGGCFETWAAARARLAAGNKVAWASKLSASSRCINHSSNQAALRTSAAQQLWPPAAACLTSPPAAPCPINHPLPSLPAAPTCCCASDLTLRSSLSWLLRGGSKKGSSSNSCSPGMKGQARTMQCGGKRRGSRGHSSEWRVRGGGTALPGDAPTPVYESCTPCVEHNVLEKQELHVALACCLQAPSPSCWGGPLQRTSLAACP